MTEHASWDLTECVSRLREFREQRDWSQFHTPKDLAAAITIEAGELQELFLWKGRADVEELLADDAQRRRVEDELADVLIYALYLADRMNADLAGIVARKITANEARYDVEHHRGKAEKAEGSAG